MPYYRLYLIVDGNIVRSRLIDASDHDLACRQAEALCPDQRWEVWINSEKVGDSQTMRGRRD